MESIYGLGSDEVDFLHCGRRSGNLAENGAATRMIEVDLTMRWACDDGDRKVSHAWRAMVCVSPRYGLLHCRWGNALLIL
jgi:hypothetical protein